MHTRIEINKYPHNINIQTDSYVPFSYKLIVRAQDKSGITTFTLFNKEAEQLIGIPIEHIISSLPEVSSILMNHFTFTTQRTFKF